MRSKPLLVAFVLLLLVDVSRVDAQWVPLTAPGGPLVALDTVLFEMTNTGMNRSTDYGATWTFLPFGIHTTTPLSGPLAYGGALFVGTHNQGVIVSTDYGATWHGPGAGMDSTTRVYDFTVLHGRVYTATSYRGIFVTSDLGATWSSVNTGLPYYGGKYPYPDLWAIGSTNTTLFLNVNPNAIYRSVNEGANWVISDSSAAQYLPFSSDGTNIYVVGANPMKRSTNNGLDWEIVNTGIYNTSDIEFARSGPILFASAKGMFASYDDGTTWADVSANMTKSTSAYPLAIAGRYLFAGNTKLWRRPISEMQQVIPAHDIHANYIVQPNSPTPVAVPTTIIVKFTNDGTSDEQNVPITATVTDPAGTVVYRDTIIVPNWRSGTEIDSAFASWTPASTGTFRVCGIALLPNDSLRSNDTACANVVVTVESDVLADSVVDPAPGEVKTAGTTWQPYVLFESVGATDLTNIPIRVRILRCSDGALAFQADTIIPELNRTAHAVGCYFPERQGAFSITNLVAGCYNLLVIARLPNDGNRSNDTARSTFSIGENGDVSETALLSSSEISVRPNPVSGLTTLHVTTHDSGPVRIAIVNLLGMEVATLFIGEMDAGEHSFVWDAKGVAAGMYWCVVRMGENVRSIPLILNS